ncbi:MAG TPA: cytochrome C oxidase subunit I, partial [Burkholderiales bacterium]|nr:cytochrome C oxidase subunit I [Burkholderiales bacterium]
MPDVLASASPKSRRTLWLLIALCAAPVIASYVAYYWWQPSGHVNYGELLQPRVLPDPPLLLADGTAFKLSRLRGKWVLLMADGAGCDAYCLEKLTYLRQLRLAQGKDSERVERVWLLTDDRLPSSAVMAQYTGTYAVRAKDTAVLATVQATGA